MLECRRVRVWGMMRYAWALGGGERGGDEAGLEVVAVVAAAVAEGEADDSSEVDDVLEGGGEVYGRTRAASKNDEVAWRVP